MNGQPQEQGMVPDNVYDEDYFERGAVLGISGYTNYAWMPELTLRMAHFLAKQLALDVGDVVLDYGCAKGYLVKALRLLDVNAHGVDISDYAIKQVPPDVASYCQAIRGAEDLPHIGRTFDWLISKDVFEHIPEEELSKLLEIARHYVAKMFLAIPLGRDDDSNLFIIPAYNHDSTHITIKTVDWWADLFSRHGWNVVSTEYKFRGMKENWTKFWEHGNAFFILEKR